jgi:hypothetical protein
MGSSPERERERKSKAIPVTGRGGLQVSEMSGIPHFLGNWLTDGRKVLSLLSRSCLPKEKIPGTHFYLSLSLSQSHSAAGIIRRI